MCFILPPWLCMSTYLIHTHEWYLIYLSRRWFCFLFVFEINYYSFPIVGEETTKLLNYLPTNPYDWQWCTRSDGHIAPAQKPNRSITCNSRSSRLPAWSPDQQNCPFIKYNCAPHTCPFRLLSPKPQTYPSVHVSKINNELTACLYTQVIVTTPTGLSTQAFSCYSSRLTANMSAQLCLSLPTNILDVYYTRDIFSAVHIHIH